MPTTPPPSQHPFARGRRRATCLVAAALAAAVVAGAAPAPAAPAPAALAPETPAAAPAAVSAPLAPPSPDLEGLPTLSLDLTAIGVEGAAVDRARSAYDDADRALRDAQVRRTDLDRAATAAAAARTGLEARAASLRARVASTRARLDQLTTAIAGAAVEMYVDGGVDARLNAAMTAEQPSINDEDRKEVLLHASLDALLADRAAYQARLEGALDELAEVEAALEQRAAEVAAVAEQRPAAQEAELAAAPPVAERRVAYEQARALGQVEDLDFVLVALDAYHRAAGTIAEENPACGVQWWAIAGISKVEGRHGTYGGASLLPNGDTDRRIIGIQLNGTNNTRAIPDSDGGALDGDPAFDRAVGPMQFIPQTWSRFAADGNEDGTASPFNLYDATLAAARYLCRASLGLSEDPGLRRAYFSYNHSEAYVESVLGWARLYAARLPLPAASAAS